MCSISAVYVQYKCRVRVCSIYAVYMQYTCVQYMCSISVLVSCAVVYRVCAGYVHCKHAVYV